MAQFKFYHSNDSGSPVLNATSGSLIDLLDACLVNGYPEHPSAGWLKPFVNTTTPHAGCWQQPSGSKFFLYVNDSGPAAGSVRDAWATGWVSMTALTTPVGSGSGQFPLPAQMLTNGHVVIRKTYVNSTYGRPWQLYADDRTFYLFVFPDITNFLHAAFFFGDIFSFISGSDTGKCKIHGRWAENSSPGESTHDSNDQGEPVNNTTAHGNFLAYSYTGVGTSIVANQVMSLGGPSAITALAGLVQTPNSADNSFYVLPLYISEGLTSVIRGRMRGLYAMAHPLASVSHGETFQGANEFTGKTFQIIKPGNLNGYWAVETSDTLDTNPY